jgi:hypothetical protein
MSIVNERMAAAHPPPPEPAKGKLAPGAVNNNKDLQVDVKTEEPSFFASFFSSTNKPGTVKKKGVAVMEAVRLEIYYPIILILTTSFRISSRPLSYGRNLPLATGKQWRRRLSVSIYAAILYR